VIAAAADVCSDPKMAFARENRTRAKSRWEAKSRREIDASPNSRKAIEELFKEHSEFVARSAYRLLGRNDEVDDVVQDVFVNLFRKLDTIRNQDAIRAWLITTTVRIARRRLRLRRFGFLLRGDQRVDPLILEGMAPSVEGRLALRTIHRALETVSVNARFAWILQHLEQLGLDDVARVLGCSHATAKRRVAVAQLAVKKALAR